MTTVKVLSYVGPWEPGQIVADAPETLVRMAKEGLKNQATGEPVAEIVGGAEGSSDVGKLRDALESAHNRELKLQKELEASHQREADLRAQIEELTKPPAGQTGDDLDTLKAQAKELKVPGYTKMSADELRAAIDGAAGGDGDAE